jgi:SAM-dependent methyltransferase
LGCGPGLYCRRLAALEHHCTGIDYSPASIAYAKEEAEQGNLPNRYLLADIRAAEYGGDYDLVMLLFGELNVFSRPDAQRILAKSLAALKPGGILLLEAHVYSSLIPKPDARNTWFSSPGGLFSPTPHLVLIEESWDQKLCILTRRYYVVDAATGGVTRYAQSMQAYRHDEYLALVQDSGFARVAIVAGVAHDHIAPPPEFHAIIAHKEGDR